MNNNAILKARKDLQAIISNYAMESYLQANRKKDGTYYKKRKPYTLPDEAMTANELLKLTYNSDITVEQEEQIKAFLIPYRTVRTEYLINTDPRMR